MKRKRTKKSALKQLKKSCESLWKEICKLRDKNACQGTFFFNHKCSKVLQVDHCWSRMNSELFFDIKNGTTLCQSMHTLKSYRVKGAEKAVDDFVRAREGEDWWLKAKKAAQSKKPVVWDVLKLEQLEINLKEQRAIYLEKRTLQEK